MKTCALLICLLSLNLSFSQTKIIANKSHSGNHASLAEERDGNFGIAPTRLDSVIKISGSCVIEINNYGWRDTVCDHPFFSNPEVTPAEMKAAYPRIIFVDFDKFEQKGKATTPTKAGKKSSEKKGSLYLLGLLLAGSLMYTFVPKKKEAN